MKNIKVDDNNFFVTYVQGILKQYYSPKVILSNFYDYNTHQSLIDFMSSYVMTSNRKIVKVLKTDKGLYYEGVNIFDKYFSIIDNVSSILLQVKDEDKVREIFKHNYQHFRRYLIKLLKSYGWVISDYDLYGNDGQYIIIQSLYPDLGIIKEDLLKMINLYNEQRILTRYKLNGTGIVYSTNSKILILNYNQDKVYTICSKRYSEQRLRVALSVKSYNDIVTNIDTNDTDIFDDIECTKVLGNIFDTSDFSKYAPSSEEEIGELNYTEYQTMLIELPYNYSDTLLIFESSIEDLLDINLKVANKEVVNSETKYTTNVEWLEKFYFSDPWLVHKELFQIFIGNVINKYSPEESIKYIQNLYKDISMDYNNKLDLHERSYGIYDDDLKQGIKNIQKLNDVLYCNGTVNTETEELLLRGSED